MLRLNPTIRSVIVLIFGLAICLALILVIRVFLTPTVMTGGKAPEIRIDWDTPAAQADTISFSGSDDYICTASNDGKIVCYDRIGNKRYSANVSGANRAVVSPDGACTLVYSHRDPDNTRLVFLDADGKESWKMNLPSAVWSVDAASDGDTAIFVVGTQEKRIYYITISKKSKRYRRFKSLGIPVSLALDLRSEQLLYTTQQPSTLRSTDLRGRVNWESNLDSNKSHFAEPLSNSNRFVLRSNANNPKDDGVVTLLEENGKDIRRIPLIAAEATNVHISPNAAFICVGYRKSIQHSGQSMPEHHAALYDYLGRKFWDKGSMLLQVTPLLVLDSGFVLTSDGEKRLFAVGPDGAIKQVCELPSSLINFTKSGDGSQAMAECADGRLYHLHIR